MDIFKQTMKNMCRGMDQASAYYKALKDKREEAQRHCGNCKFFEPKSRTVGTCAYHNFKNIPANAPSCQYWDKAKRS